MLAINPIDMFLSPQAQGFLDKQTLKQRQLKERYKSSINKYIKHDEARLGEKQLSKKKLTLPEQVLNRQKVYFPVNLDKITYSHQHSSSNRIKSLENNTIKAVTRSNFKNHKKMSTGRNSKVNMDHINTPAGAMYRDPRSRSTLNSLDKNNQPFQTIDQQPNIMFIGGMQQHLQTIQPEIKQSKLPQISSKGSKPVMPKGSKFAD